MRIVLACAGSRGDVQPLQALGFGLAGVGHSVILCASSDFAASSGALGLEFAPVGQSARMLLERYFSAMATFPIAPPGDFRREMLREVESHFVALARAARGADLIVAASLECAAPTVAQMLRVPYRYVVLCPAVLPSRAHPPWVVPWQRLPGWTNRLLWWGIYTAMNRTMMKPVSICRQRRGLPAVRSGGAHVLGRRPILASDAVFGAAPTDGPFAALQTASLHVPARGDLPADLERFLAAGAPPVYVGFGSMLFDDPARVTETLVEVVAAQGRRAIVAAGWGRVGERVSRGDVFATGDVPHGLLFPRVAAVVHHGGAGTTAAAARAGVPQVVVPRLLDQFYWAERVRRAGLGPAAVPFSRLTHANLTAAVAVALGDATMVQRCRDVGVRLRARDGVAETIAELVGPTGAG
jgi:vancomycin aglycone glucosyltransferase